MGRVVAGVILMTVVVVAGLAAGAAATGPLPAGVLAMRPAAAEVPVEHLAQLAAPAEARNAPGGSVVATLQPGVAIRTGDTVRDGTGHWHEIITPTGLVWVEAAAFAFDSAPPLR